MQIEADIIILSEVGSSQHPQSSACHNKQVATADTLCHLYLSPSKCSIFHIKKDKTPKYFPEYSSKQPLPMAIALLFGGIDDGFPEPFFLPRDLASLLLG